MKDPNSQSSTNPKTPEISWHRRWLVNVWNAHGGGLYAVGYAVTFLYLEARTILEELIEADGPIDFLTNHLFEFIFRFMSDSIMNMVQAFIWFLPVIEFRPPFGIMTLGIGFYVFDIYLREPVARWLLGEEGAEEPAE